MLRMSMRVFISHSSKDKPAVEALALALRERGIDFIDCGNYVVVRGTQRAGNDKGSFEAPFLHLLEYGDDGKTRRGEFFTDSAKAAKLLA